MRVLAILLLCAAAWWQGSANAQDPGPDDVAWLRQEYLSNRTQKFIRKAIQPSEAQDCNSLSSLGWFREYTAWHAQELQRPTARFLLFMCGTATWMDNMQPAAGTDMRRLQASRQARLRCGSLGDRFQGMLEVVRLAAYANRAVLFHWSTPLELEQAMVPADLDWRVKPDYALDVSKAPVILWDAGKPQPSDLADGTWKDAYSEARVVIVQLSAEDTQQKLFPYWPGLGSHYSAERACVFRSLFKPSQTVQQMVDLQRKAALGDSGRPYVAIHLRLNKIPIELYSKTLRHFDPVKLALSSLVCARAMAAHANITDTPILLVTDSELLQHVAEQGLLTGVTTPLLKHIVDEDEEIINPHLATFVDLMLLSEATCFLRSPSSFSDTAWRMGHHTCTSMMADCLSAVYEY